MLRLTVNCITSPTYSLAKYLAGLLNLLSGQSVHQIIYSEMFVQKLHIISLQEPIILVSFNVASLFTKVTLEDTLLLLSQHFDNHTIHPIRQVIISVYFLYDGTFYDQLDGVAMGSPLAFIIANSHLEYFE
jgi:hypothetical protein